MNTIVVPTLSLDGWVKSTPERADYLMAHFFESEYSQTAFYKDKVSSFQWIIQKNQGDMTATVRMLKNTLTDYFSRYFTNVVVEVNHEDIVLNSSNVKLIVYISFRDEKGRDFSVGRLAELVDSKLQKVIVINNELGA